MLVDELLRRRLKANWSTIITVINLDDGSLDELSTKNCISQTQRKKIKELSSSDGKQKLLEIVSRKSRSAFDSFLACLEVTKQHEVLFLIKDNAGIMLSLLCISSSLFLSFYSRLLVFSVLYLKLVRTCFIR